MPYIHPNSAMMQGMNPYVNPGVIYTTRLHYRKTLSLNPFLYEFMSSPFICYIIAATGSPGIGASQYLGYPYPATPYASSWSVYPAYYAAAHPASFLQQQAHAAHAYNRMQLESHYNMVEAARMQHALLSRGSNADPFMPKA